MLYPGSVVPLAMFLRNLWKWKKLVRTSCKWCHLVAKFVTNASGVISWPKFAINASGASWWPNLDSMQVAFYLAGEITQVIDSIPWVRCASGNVSSPPPSPSPVTKPISIKHQYFHDSSVAFNISYKVGKRTSEGFIWRWQRQRHKQRQIPGQRQRQKKARRASAAVNLCQLPAETWHNAILYFFDLGWSTQKSKYE